MRNVPFNSFPTAFLPNLPISCSAFNSQKKRKKQIPKDYVILFTRLSLRLYFKYQSQPKQQRFTSK